VFENNPHLRVLKSWPASDFDLMQNCDFVTLEPYYLSAYRRGEISLREAIIRTIGEDLPVDLPELFVTEDEDAQLEKYLSKFERPFIAYQPFGASYDVGKPTQSPIRTPHLKQLTELGHFLKDYGSVFVMRGLNQPHLEDMFHPDLNLRRSLIYYTQRPHLGKSALLFSLQLILNNYHMSCIMIINQFVIALYFLVDVLGREYLTIFIVHLV